MIYLKKIHRPSRTVSYNQYWRLQCNTIVLKEIVTHNSSMAKLSVLAIIAIPTIMTITIHGLCVLYHSFYNQYSSNRTRA